MSYAIFSRVFCPFSCTFTKHPTFFQIHRLVRNQRVLQTTGDCISITVSMQNYQFPCYRSRLNAIIIISSYSFLWIFLLARPRQIDFMSSSIFSVFARLMRSYLSRNSKHLDFCVSLATWPVCMRNSDNNKHYLRLKRKSILTQFNDDRVTKSISLLVSLADISLAMTWYKNKQILILLDDRYLVLQFLVLSFDEQIIIHLIDVKQHFPYFSQFHQEIRQNVLKVHVLSPWSSIVSSDITAVII